MAQRRRVNNLTALAVLSAVAQRPMHPYEMATALRAWGKEQDMPIKWGSFYTVVRNMEKHGLLVAVESTREGKRPERTVYEITDAGRAELVDWARELISTPEPERPRLRAGLSVMAVLHPDDTIALLRQRLGTVETGIAETRRQLAGDTTPRLFLVEVEYDLALREAEAAWIRSLLEELTQGTFDGLEVWRDFHETGELPPEVTELIDKHR